MIKVFLIFRDHCSEIYILVVNNNYKCNFQQISPLQDAELLEAGRRLAVAQGALSVAHSTDAALAAAREEAAASREQYQVCLSSHLRLSNVLVCANYALKLVLLRNVMCCWEPMWRTGSW